MKIYFVRHGEAVSNKMKTRQGSEEPLSEEGRRQAHIVAKRLKNIPIDLFISSTLVRARETADIMSSEIQKSPNHSELFIERKNSLEIIGLHETDPKAMAIWDQYLKRFHEDWHHSNEENFFDLKKRAEEAISFLEKSGHEKILVVTHGGFLAWMVGSMLFGTEMTSHEMFALWRFLLTQNTGITVCEYIPTKKEDKNRGWRLLTWNDHSHLDDFDKK